MDRLKRKLTWNMKTACVIREQILEESLSKKVHKVSSVSHTIAMQGLLCPRTVLIRTLRLRVSVLSGAITYIRVPMRTSSPSPHNHQEKPLCNHHLSNFKSKSSQIKKQLPQRLLSTQSLKMQTTPRSLRSRICLAHWESSWAAVAR